MSAREKLDAFARRDKIKKYLLILTPLMLVVGLVGSLIPAQLASKWEHSEVVGEMMTMTPIELKTGNSYQIVLNLDGSEQAVMNVDRIAVFKKGRKAVLRKSVNLDNGKEIYSYVRTL